MQSLSNHIEIPDDLPKQEASMHKEKESEKILVSLRLIGKGKAPKSPLRVRFVEMETASPLREKLRNFNFFS